MEPLVFDHLDYKQYLNALAEARPRGFRSQLASATGCQTAYVSHVLNGPGHFNLEQACAAARFLELARDETRYLLVLVEHNRAGTSQLRKILSEQLHELREQHLLLKKRVGIKATLSRELQQTYYSSWHYSAVHIACTVDALRTRTALSKGLGLSARKLTEVLDFLVASGLLTRRGETFEPGSTLLHLEKDSPLIHQHHSNWRHRALESLSDDEAEQNMHYSSVVSLSASDAQRLRQLIAEHLSLWTKLIKESPEEQIHGLNIDFFRVDRAAES